MTREKGHLIKLADDEDVGAAAAEFGVTPHQIRAAAFIVGRSFGALSRYFRDRRAAAGQTVAFPERYPLIKELADLFARYQAEPDQLDLLVQAIRPKFNQAVRAMHQGDIRLDYLPPEGDTVSMPAPGDGMYLQALFYWHIRLGAPIPDLREALAVCGVDPTVEEVTGRLVQIARKRR